MASKRTVSVMTESQVLREYPIAERLVRAAIKDGTLPSWKVGRVRFFDRDEVERWIRSHGQPAAEARL